MIGSTTTAPGIPPGAALHVRLERFTQKNERYNLDTPNARIRLITMTQNTGEHANTNDIPGLTQTPEAQRQTELTASITKQTPTIGAVINNLGRNLGVLAWFVNNHTGNMFAKIDNGTIYTASDGKGEVTVKMQDRNTGRVRTYQMPDVVSAFYALGLSANVCNGIDGWRDLASMSRTAGRD